MKMSVKAGIKTLCTVKNNMDPAQLQKMKQIREAKKVGEADLLTKTGSHVVGKTMGKLDPNRIKAASTAKSYEDFMKIEGLKEKLEELSKE